MQFSPSLSACCLASDQIYERMNRWVWSFAPGGAADELGELGDEEVRMSPKLERRLTETTHSTRMITNVTKPTIAVRRPPLDTDTGTAMPIFAGGGYWNLYWEVEGEEIADWLTSNGITAILLK